MARAAAAAAAVGSGGRAAVRGGGEPRPGADVAGAQRGMEGLSVGGGGGRGGGQARRRGALLFIAEPHTRPAHITDKRGEYMPLSLGVPSPTPTGKFRIQMYLHIFSV